MKRICAEPYSVFFILGLLYALWGAALWIPPALGWTSDYPIVLHSHIMIGGFLGAFAFGFLMTAIPRFTRTYPPHRHEFIWVAAPLVLLPIPILFKFDRLADALVLLSVLGLIKFAGERFKNRNTEPPDSFVFIGIALFCATAGSLLMLLAPAGLAQIGKTLFLQGFILSLIAGVGSRLIPALLGWGPMPNANLEPRSDKRKKLNPFLVLGVLLVLSLAAESRYGDVSRIAKAVVISVVAVRFWKITSHPLNRSILAWCIWISAWSILAGLWGSALSGMFWSSAYQIHFLHLTFISGFGLMSLLIGTRVVLAHGGFSLTLENELKALYWISGITLSAAALRAFAILLPRFYLPQTGIAAGLWIIAISIWFLNIGLKILYPKP